VCVQVSPGDDGSYHCRGREIRHVGERVWLYMSCLVLRQSPGKTKELARLRTTRFVGHHWGPNSAKHPIIEVPETETRGTAM
jgi:hypothetical protein